jgi:hypothetical protein
VAGGIVALLLWPASCSSELTPGTGSQGNAGTGGAAAGSAGSGTAGTGNAPLRPGTCSDHSQCGPGQACQPECFGDSGGFCVTLPTACDAIARPVCGCDDKTYANACVLESVPGPKAYDGECVVTPVGADGSAALVPGVWSGTGIRMVVTATGATISLGCMQGTIDAPLIVGPRIWFQAGSRPATLPGTVTSGATTSPATYILSMSQESLNLYLNDYDPPFWLLRYGDQGAPSCP